MESAPSISLDTQELERLNQEIYKQNVELAIRNRTLSILQQVYQIINSTLGVRETSQKLLEAVVKDLKFQLGFIALIEGPQRELKTHALYVPPELSEIKYEKFVSYFKNLEISLQYSENFCVKSISENRKRLTNFLHDIFIPILDKETAQKIQDKLNIKTCVIFPLVFADQKFGVLVLALDKHLGFLSRAESETLKELIDVVAIAIERAQIYADLRRANRRLRGLDELKDEFVSLVSHELRTPLTAIKGYMWLLLNQKNVDSQKKKLYSERVYISTERLIHLVNDMLNVSRIETGRLQLNSQRLNIVKLALEVKDEIAARAGQKKVTVKVDAAKPYFVFVDLEKLREVFLNIIGNSLKFTPEGGVVSIEFAQEDNFVQTKISDTGVGIKKEDMDKLFIKFGRLNNSFSSMSEVPGTGLGLYICKKIIELSRGKIWAESEIGKGSKFYFTLPFRD